MRYAKFLKCRDYLMDTGMMTDEEKSRLDTIVDDVNSHHWLTRSRYWNETYAPFVFRDVICDINNRIIVTKLVEKYPSGAKTSFDESGMDPGVIPLVNYFNRVGLKTIMSCQGHGTVNQSVFWIEFDPSVTEEDVIAFQRKHARDYDGAFCSNGDFAWRFYLLEGETYRSLRYIVGTIVAANDDLKRWQEDDRKNQVESEE